MKIGDKVIMTNIVTKDTIYTVSGILTDNSASFDKSGVETGVEWELEPEDVLILDDGETEEISTLKKYVSKVVVIK